MLKMLRMNSGFVQKILLVVCLMVGSLFLVSNTNAQVILSELDKQQISHTLDNLAQIVTMGDTQSIGSVVSDDNLALQAEIIEKIRGGIEYQLDYTPFDKKVVVVDASHVKVKARFAATGIGWDVNGLTTNFVLEKQGNQWLITETDFHQRLGVDYVLDILKKVFVVVGIVSVFLTAFWLWMIVDCANRDFENKRTWIILLMLLSTVGAIAYFFMIKLKDVKRQPPIYQR